jgi:hypothetical protein
VLGFELVEKLPRRPDLSFFRVLQALADAFLCIGAGGDVEGGRGADCPVASVGAGLRPWLGFLKASQAMKHGLIAGGDFLR